MPSRVFISCGQASESERRVAGEIKQWFQSQGFIPCVAIQTQSLSDVNSGIIQELKRSDFYVFVDFRRERFARNGVVNPLKRYTYRGSLFTNQELAIVYLLQFEKVLFFQQDGIELDGLLRYMASNATKFARIEDVPALVSHKAKERAWHPSYTRHLAIGSHRWSPPIQYGDHTGQRLVKVFYVDVHNYREDLGAMSAICRLEYVVNRGSRARMEGIDRSPLKTTGQPGYAQVIWPRSHGCWDFFAVSVEEPSKVYLNSALDVYPRQPIITVPGQYALSYEVFAENFPVLRFQIELQFTGKVETIQAEVNPESEAA